MYKYLLEFSKTGTICFISHLDTMRLFKRSFKRAGIDPAYSKGFNPHPKMSFAQPLALGYEGLAEYMEFETEDYRDPGEVKEKINRLMPEGIKILRCLEAAGMTKTLASAVEAAEYLIKIPAENLLGKEGEEMKEAYMGSPEIMAEKVSKKKKRTEYVDIKPMIRDISLYTEEGILTAEAVLDCGSRSNLSPELVIKTLDAAFCLKADRSEAEVTRRRIFFGEEQEKILKI
ncbi:MAG TPA: DUF2344 domain-containing protein [Candidatus Copromorpha excrementigallinarum]|uniref:DUF2344 domain-containing protein n=1 Tax=Candidatus Allocopromorpha excrementigallinarum TaxID=2840742 RepID=A0A9D1L6C5_9FIRM|nr:DUF2344 domain-containing protein [Candidatus Copromorpha excrementigallinarum]